MEPEYLPKLLICLDCGGEFEFTVEQQREHAEKGFAHEPRRCRTCRDKHRREGRDHPGRPAAAGSSAPARAGSAAPARARPRQFYMTVCSRCGAPARVPFEPIAGRAVLCRTCLDAQRTNLRIAT